MEILVCGKCKMTHNYLKGWFSYPEVKPTETKRYLVYRKGCDKIHFQKWNHNGWAYNEKDTTHWCELLPPKI